MKSVRPYPSLAYCVKQGWLIKEGAEGGAKYKVTRKGMEELKKLGIET